MRTPGIGDLTGYDLQVERIIQRYLDKRVPILRADINNDIQNAVRGGIVVQPTAMPSDDNPESIGSSPHPGADNSYARSDHVHELITGDDDYMTVGFTSGSLNHSFNGVKVLADGADVGQRPKLNFSGLMVEDNTDEGFITIVADQVPGGGGSTDGSSVGVLQTAVAQFPTLADGIDDIDASVTIPPNAIVKRVAIRHYVAPTYNHTWERTTNIYAGAISPPNLMKTLTTPMWWSGPPAITSATITSPDGDFPSGITINARMHLDDNRDQSRFGLDELIVDYDLMVPGLGQPIQVSQDKVLGRKSAGTGDVEEIDCTPAARTLLDDSSTSDMRTTLGLGSSDKPTFGGLTLPATTFVYPMYAKYGAPTSGTYTTGTIAIDLGGAMFVCTSGGSPGTWLQTTNAKIDTGNWSTFNNTSNWNGGAFQAGYYVNEQGIGTWIRDNTAGKWVEDQSSLIPITFSPGPPYTAPLSTSIGVALLSSTTDYRIDRVIYRMYSGGSTDASNYWVAAIKVGGSTASDHKLDDNTTHAVQESISTSVTTSSQIVAATLDSTRSPSPLYISISLLIRKVRK